jgi:uncharacterized cupredoxin-like copper-binding protein
MLTDNKIALDKATATGGTVTFNVANTGTVVHSSCVLICNEPAHYVVGMHVAFTVK